MTDSSQPVIRTTDERSRRTARMSEREKAKLAEMMMARLTEGVIFAQAVCAGKARWEPFSGLTDQGEVCVNGLRFSTHLEDGFPILNPRLSAELEKASGR